MGDRPARIYREHPGQPYTRQSQKKNDNYIKGAPAPRVIQYEMGARDKEFSRSVVLQVEEECAIRSEALESARVAANSHLSKVLEPTEDYFLKIIPYPHHVLRYHPLAGIAQADRYYEGMRKPFGRPIGRAALVDKDQEVMRVDLEDEDIPEAKKALERAGHKLPVSCRVRIQR